MAWTSAVITVALVAAHVKHYTHPHVQRHINRVVLIVPVFSLLSWVSLAAGDNTGVYIESVRDCYESWVVYNFMVRVRAWVCACARARARSAARRTDSSVSFLARPRRCVWRTSEALVRL
jgi:hypothetical protein